MSAAVRFLWQCTFVTLFTLFHRLLVMRFSISVALHIFAFSKSNCTTPLPMFVIFHSQFHNLTIMTRNAMKSYEAYLKPIDRQWFVVPALCRHKLSVGLLCFFSGATFCAARKSATGTNYYMQSVSLHSWFSANFEDFRMRMISVLGIYPAHVTKLFI